MPITFPQYLTLYQDTTLAPQLKAFAARRLRNYYAAQGQLGAAEFVNSLSQLESSAFVERLRVELLGQLDEGNIPVPTAGDIATAGLAAVRAVFGIPTL